MADFNVYARNRSNADVHTQATRDGLGRLEAQAALGTAARAFLLARLQRLRERAHYVPGDDLAALAERGGRVAELEDLLILSNPEEPATR